MTFSSEIATNWQPTRHAQKQEVSRVAIETREERKKALEQLKLIGRAGLSD